MTKDRQKATDDLGGHLDYIYEIVLSIEIQTCQDSPDRDVMKAKSKELVRVAKEVRRKVKAF